MRRPMPRMDYLTDGHLRLIELLAEQAVGDWMSRQENNREPHASRNLCPLQQRQAEREFRR